MGTAGDFAVLAYSTVTNTGNTVIDGGDVGVSPGTSITGFGPGVLKAPYTFHHNDAVAIQAQKDLTKAYNAAEALTGATDMTGADLGGKILTAGVYKFSSSVGLTGTLTLDAQGDSNAQFVFQIGSTLVTASASKVVMINGGAAPGHSVFWQVGSSATLGTTTEFEGHILALASITMTTGATILDGSAMALNGAVTLDSNKINNSNSAGLRSVPEPGTITLALVGGSLLGLPILRKRFRERKTLRLPSR